MGKSNTNYRDKLAKDGELRYPFLPCVDVGTKKRPVLIPMELVVIIAGQTRQRGITGDVSAMIIKHAAMLPNDRFQNISTKSTLFPALLADEDAQKFGLCTTTAMVSSTSTTAITASGVPRSPLPVRVLATILPPAKLQYGNRVIEPQLKGSWNLADRVTFAHPAPLNVPIPKRRGEGGSSSREGGRTSSPTR